MKKVRHRVTPHSYTWLRYTELLYFFIFTVFISVYIRNKSAFALSGIITMLFIGLIFIMSARYLKLYEARKISRLINQHIVENDLCQIEYENTKLKYIFYPDVHWWIDKNENLLHIKFGLTGNKINLRGLEQGLSDRLRKPCFRSQETYGYIIYSFQAKQFERLKLDNTMKLNNSQISMSKEIKIDNSLSWNYHRDPGFCIVGTSGSGKTTLTKYFLAQLTACEKSPDRARNRIFYIDIKRDDDMELFCKKNNMIHYVYEKDDILKTISEFQIEFEKRQSPLDNKITVDQETSLFLICDEIILLKLLLSKKEYDQIMNAISSIIVGGRSKNMYIGLISQAAHAEFFGNSGYRENLSLKIALGFLSSSEYGMLFGQEFSDVKNLNGEIGSGLVQLKNSTRPREFIAQYIKQDDDL